MVICDKKCLVRVFYLFKDKIFLQIFYVQFFIQCSFFEQYFVIFVGDDFFDDDKIIF